MDDHHHEPADPGCLFWFIFLFIVMIGALTPGTHMGWCILVAAGVGLFCAGAIAASNKGSKLEGMFALAFWVVVGIVVYSAFIHRNQPHDPYRRAVQEQYDDNAEDQYRE